MIVTDSRKPSLLLLISRFKEHNSSAACTYTIITRAHMRSIRTCLTAAFVSFVLHREHAAAGVQPRGPGLHLHHSRRLRRLRGILCGRGGKRYGGILRSLMNRINVCTVDDEGVSFLCPKVL